MHSKACVSITYTCTPRASAHTHTHSLTHSLYLTDASKAALHPQRLATPRVWKNTPTFPKRREERIFGKFLRPRPCRCHCGTATGLLGIFVGCIYLKNVRGEEMPPQALESIGLEPRCTRATARVWTSYFRCLKCFGTLVGCGRTRVSAWSSQRGAM